MQSVAVAGQEEIRHSQGRHDCVCLLSDRVGSDLHNVLHMRMDKEYHKKKLHNIVAKNTKHTKLFVCGRALKASRAEHSTEQALFQLIKHFGQTKPQEQHSRSLFRSRKKIS